MVGGASNAASGSKVIGATTTDEHAPRWDPAVDLAPPVVDDGEGPMPDREGSVVADGDGGRGAEVAVDQANRRRPALVDGDARSRSEPGAGHRDMLSVDQPDRRIDRQRRHFGRTRPAQGVHR
jgi:hypothetical protein